MFRIQFYMCVNEFPRRFVIKALRQELPSWSSISATMYRFREIDWACTYSYLLPYQHCPVSKIQCKLFQCFLKYCQCWTQRALSASCYFPVISMLSSLNILNPLRNLLQCAQLRGFEVFLMHLRSSFYVVIGINM